MADTYEKDLAQKSSLTTSDYIRVVGSDNVSYKQLVSSVMGAMGINTSIDLGIVTDLNSTINNHTKTYSIDYYNSSASNKPSGNSGIVITQGNGNYRGQFAIDLGGALFSRTYANGTISAWTALPLKNSFSIRSVTWAYTIDANSNTNTNLYTLINNDLPSGATCLGVVGFSTNTVNVVPIAMQYYNSNYSAQLRNISNSSVSNNLNVRYLCLA